MERTERSTCDSRAEGGGSGKGTRRRERMVVAISSRRSSIKNAHRRGPRMEPWGQPRGQEAEAEKRWGTQTRCVRPMRYAVIQRQRYSGKWRRRRTTSIFKGETRQKASEKSTATSRLAKDRLDPLPAPSHFRLKRPPSTQELIKWTKRKSAEIPGRRSYSHWWRGEIRKKCSRHCKMRTSRRRQRRLVIATGRWEAGRCGSLFGLRNGMRTEVRQECGTKPDEIREVKC